MNHKRYPLNPVVAHSKVSVDISYNGVKVKISKIPGRQPHSVRLYTIDDHVQGQPQEKEVILGHVDEHRLRRIDLKNKVARAYLGGVVRNHAEWFDDTEEDKLVEIVERHLEVPKTEPAIPVHGKYRVALPFESFHREQSRRFREIWLFALSRNIHEEEAAKRLGYHEFYK